MHDILWQVLITSIASIVIAWLQLRTKAAVDKTAAKVEEDVATTHAVHHLVNNATEVLLHSNAELARWKADRTGNPEHRRAAERAEKAYLDHVERQAKLDEAAKAPVEEVKDVPPPVPDKGA